MWIDPLLDDSAYSMTYNRGEGRVVLLTDSPVGGRTVPTIRIVDSVIEGTVVIRMPSLPLGGVCATIYLDDCEIYGLLEINLLGWSQKNSFVQIRRCRVHGNLKISCVGMKAESHVNTHLSNCDFYGNTILKNIALPSRDGSSQGLLMHKCNFKGNNCVEMKSTEWNLTKHFDGATFLNAGVVLAGSNLITSGTFELQQFDLRPF